MQFPSSKELERNFLAAMARGFASDNKPEGVADQTLAKQFRTRFGDILVEDRWYFRAGSIHSGGQTVIWYKGEPVWYMSYYGRYREEALPFLKQVLRQNYIRRPRFQGGRGPEVHNGRTMTYANAVDSGSSFEKFSGREAIYDRRDGMAFGEHRYMGGMI